MANEKFSKIVQLIREVIGLIADLIPMADTALELVESARKLIADFKEKREELND